MQQNVFRSKRTLHVKLPFWASFIEIEMGMARITNIYLKFYFVVKKHNVYTQIRTIIRQTYFMIRSQKYLQSFKKIINILSFQLNVQISSKSY